MAAAVLDSHALLALFRGEDAAVQVKDLLHKAASTDRPLHMTEVNYVKTGRAKHTFSPSIFMVKFRSARFT